MRVNEADETGKIPYSEVNRRAAYEAMRIQQNRNLKCQVGKSIQSESSLVISMGCRKRRLESNY